MTEMLTDFLEADLLEKLSGDDARIGKIEGAAAAIAEELRAEPRRLIGAILAALDPDLPANDPAAARAAQALEAEWRTVRSIYTSPPIGLYRAILFDACQRAADGKCAAIAWLTAVDTLPLMRLGREEAAVGRMLEALARRTEELALALPPPPAESDNAEAGGELPGGSAAAGPRVVNRSELLLRVAAAAGPGLRKVTLTNPNPHWPNEGATWSYEFADRMHHVLADELDSLARDLGENAILFEKFGELQTSQRRWVSEALRVSAARKKFEAARLDVLWWSEAMYSRSLRRGYREFPAPLAAVAMALDLLDEVPKPTLASVAYLLAESVQRLPGAEFTRYYSLSELLRALQTERKRLPHEWSQRLRLPTHEGRLSLRDLVFASLASDADPAPYVARAGLSGEVALSLPGLAKALFRQEQAVQLAGGDL